jgi:hypothetical protein
VREAADEVGGLLQADQERERRAGTDGGSVRRLEVDVLDRTRRATSLPLLVSSPSVSSRRRPTLPRSTRGQRRMRSQKLPNQAGRYRRGGRHEGGRERGKGLRIASTEGTRQPASQIVGRPACLPATSTLEEHGSSTDSPPTTNRPTSEEARIVGATDPSCELVREDAGWSEEAERQIAVGERRPSGLPLPTLSPQPCLPDQKHPLPCQLEENSLAAMLAPAQRNWRGHSDSITSDGPRLAELRRPPCRSP